MLRHLACRHRWISVSSFFIAALAAGAFGPRHAWAQG